jgi:hypothetical protein
MKKLAFILLLSASLNAEFLQQDKKYHIASGLVTYSVCIVLSEILKKQDVTDHINSKTCVLPVVAVAVGKELYDSRHDNHTADFNDFTATVFAPLLISYTIEF